MLKDARFIESGSHIETDLCIIGAGAAGLSIAQEFIGNKTNIVLVESGTLEFDSDTQSLYEGEDEAIGLGNTRSRYFGGSTNCWRGRCAPLDPMDFETRDWIPNSGWPISQKDLVPHYRRACKLLRLGSFDKYYSAEWDVNLFPGQFFRALKSTDSKFVGTPFFQSEEPHLRFGPRFIDPLKKDKHIDVYLNANVVQLEINALANQIKKAHIATLSGKKFFIQAKQFVLALGGIENPRILLTSNMVETSGIGNRNDLVGRYFMDHSFTDIGHLVYSGDQLCFEKELIQATVGQVCFKPYGQVQKKEQLLNTGIWVDRVISKGEVAFRNFGHNLLRGNFSKKMGEQLMQMSEDIDDLSHSAACMVQGKSKAQELWGIMVQGEQPPNPENRVMLGNERDALGTRRLRVKRSMSELGRQSVLRSIELFAAEIMRHKLGRVRIDETYIESRLFTDGNVDTQYGHDMGTTRMADNPKNGVVDKHCKVHGISNLYIGGSSVFPTGGFANPTLTIIALALRIADQIKATF